MRYATVYTAEKDFNHFIELAKSLSYVQKIVTDKKSTTSTLDNITAGLEEIRQFNDGKLHTTPAKDFLNEL